MHDAHTDAASSRGDFLKTAGGAGAAGALAAFLSACGAKKAKTTPGGSNANTAAGVGTDQYGPGDLGIARYALTLEYLEADFYAKAIASGKLTGRAADFARTFAQHEAAHVKALEAAVGKLGGKPPLRPKASFPLSSSQSIITFAVSIEGLGVAALLGQADRIESKSLLASALSMHTVEARHTAALAMLTGRDPSPQGAFAQPQTAGDVFQQLHRLTTGNIP